MGLEAEAAGAWTNHGNHTIQRSFTGTPYHRYHPRPTDPRMRANLPSLETMCRFWDPAGLSRVDGRTFIINRDSAVNAEFSVILRLAVLAVLVGLEAKPAGGWQSWDKTPPEFSIATIERRYPVPPVPP